MLPSDSLTKTATGPIRCAIYTRKSTEEGLSQDFNSLDAQRECAEAYIQSQRQQGWVVLPTRYDDGGFTGATLDRPALQQLLADIEAGKIDCVVIYKVDRLSRSLFDFARLMQIFDRYQVSFVSVTQQFNSSTPMGRLTLNILLSFAQFERELISERTRDKISAARRKGKWMGGNLVLGYDPDPNQTRLIVNEAEAQQVREIFALFVRHRSLVLTLEEMDKRGWHMKSWTTRQGEHHAGKPFDRHSLQRLLSNAIYLGEVKHKGKTYPGEQSAIVDRKLWRRANELLGEQRSGTDGRGRQRQGALLQDLLVCAACGQRIVPGFTTKRGRRYPYYICLTAQKRGAKVCPGRLVSAQWLEEAVVEGLYQAGSRQGEELRNILTMEHTVWQGLEREQQRQILVQVIERISYDRRLQQGRLRLRPEMVSEGVEEILFRAGKKSLVQQLSPERVARASRPEVPARLPRITKLMALAVRMEGLLRDGTVKNHVELARLGSVSRSRITQILNLRNLAPVLQERLLSLSAGEAAHPVNERTLRRISGWADWRQQITQFEELTIGRVPGPKR
ncbi:MAG: resolvase [Terriglobia bacterium]|nr:MAG: resolvase [Terriglobia bacterium]